jgi:putative transcriptional regulator
MYHYTESGLDNVYLSNGYDETTEDGEEFVSFTDAYGLHRLIASRIAHQDNPLNGKECRFLRVEMNMSQKTLAFSFDVDTQTIARWEKGQSPIPRTSDVSLRAMYLESVDSESNTASLLKQIAENEGTLARLEIEIGMQDNHWKVAA